MSNKPQENRSKAWFWCLLFLALVGFGWSLYFLPTSNSVAVVNDQLKMIRAKQFTQSYYDYTSKAFQQKISLYDFKQFLLSLDPFFDNAEFVEHGEEASDETSRVSGVLISKTHKELEVEYFLVKEDKAWKIDEIEFKDPEDVSFSEEEETENPPFVFMEDLSCEGILERVVLTDEKTKSSEKIKSITVGDEVDHIGLIKKARNVIDSDVNMIFFNVRIEHGKAGALVSLFVKHLDSGSSTSPLSTMLKKDGLTVATFSYAAPTKGWPVGDYIIKVTLGSEDEMTAAFQVRKGEKEFY